MNKTETEYANLLFLAQSAGEILSYKYEPIKLRLANRTYYSPDFLVIASDGVVELHEVKGHWEDDARVKVKVAAEQFPWFKFVAIKKVKGRWEREEF